jgi:methyl-accepting chemotaxis protein
LRVEVLTSVAVACLVALLIGILGLVQLGALQQRSQDINTDGLVPSNQIAEVRRAFLQTRIDALADAGVQSRERRRNAATASGAKIAVRTIDQPTDTATGCCSGQAASGAAGRPFPQSSRHA